MRGALAIALALLLASAPGAYAQTAEVAAAPTAAASLCPLDTREELSPVPLCAGAPAPYAGALYPRWMVDECNACALSEGALRKAAVAPAPDETRLEWPLVISLTVIAGLVGFGVGMAAVAQPWKN